MFRIHFYVWAFALAIVGMARYASQEQAARHFQTTDRTIRNWLGKGYFPGYRIGPRRVVVDLDEIEAFLESVPPSVARDGRKVYGPNARIVALPRTVVMAEPEADR